MINMRLSHLYVNVHTVLRFYKNNYTDTGINITETQKI